MSNDQEHIRTFSSALQMFVGQGKRYSVEAVAAASGVSLRNVRAYHGGQHDPSWANALAIMNVLPPEFSAEVLRDAGIVGVEKDGGPDGCTRKLHTVLASEVADLTQKREDGAFDHREDLETEQRMRALRATIDSWLSTPPEQRRGSLQLIRGGRIA